MKKIIIPSLALLGLLACNSGDSGGDKAPEETAKPADFTQSPVYKEGLQLVADNGCPTCHKIDDKVTGPTYREVANKYGSEPEDKIVPYLAGKIIAGGSGVWGQIPMIPHPTVTQADAEKMAKYILLLKK
jgi:cytochrome c